MKYLIMLCLSLLFVTETYASVDEIQLEDIYQRKAQYALDMAFGSGNFIVNVDIKLSAPQYKVQYTEESKPKLNNTKKESADKLHILPGYPVIRNLSASDMNKMPFNSITTYIQPRIRSVSVQFIVNKAFPKGKVGRAKKLIRELLQLPSASKIKVRFQPFYAKDLSSQPQEIIIKDQNQKLMTYQNFFYAALLLLGILFLIIYAIFQFIGYRRTTLTEDNKDSSPNISVSPNIELPKQGGGASDSIQLQPPPNIKRYFDFIQHENIEMVDYVIKLDKLTPEHLSIILSFLDPSLSQILLSKQDIKVQSHIAGALLQQKQINRALIEKLESRIKDKIECLIGGKDIFEQLFSHVSSDSKKQILGILSKTSPENYKRFRQNILIFDDIKFLSDDEIKLLLSDIKMESLATAMLSVEQQTSQRIEENLTRSAKDMIGQFLELKRTMLSKQDIQIAQDLVLAQIIHLEEEGRIQLKSKIKV